jgi:hypothetical protein
MPIQLPPGNTTKEKQAAAFIELVEKRLPLTPGLATPHIARACYAVYAQTQHHPRILACAGYLIARYLPIVGITNQWAFMVTMHCPPPQPISDNAEFFAFTTVALLASLHSQVTSRKPATLDDFRRFAHGVIDPIIKDSNVPEPPFTLDVLSTVRAGYATLADHYYAP